MNTIAKPRLDLRQTRDVADDAQRVQLSLGGRKKVPSAAWAFASSLVEAIWDADDEWAEGQDPENRMLLLRAALGMSRGLSDRAAPDARRNLMLGLQRSAEVLDRISEGEEVSAARSPRQVAGWLSAAVEAPQAEIAALVGTSPRSFSRWMSGDTTPDGEDARRLRTVAALVSQLRFSLTGVGVLRWFDWPNELLGDRTPRQALGDAQATPTLFRLAARLRSSIAA